MSLSSVTPFSRMQAKWENLVQETAGDFKLSITQLGMAGTLFIILHAYSLGGGYLHPVSKL